GPLLRGRDYYWADEYARYYEHAYVHMLEDAARRCLSASNAEKALQYYRELLKVEALRDDIYGELVRLLMRLGRKAEALQYYNQLEHMLQSEFGALPDASLRQLIREAT